MKYFFIIGSHGVGKTTLLEELKKDDDLKGFSFINEVIREMYINKEIELFEGFTNIIDNQIKIFNKLKEKLEQNKNGIIICDRSFVDIYAYTYFLYYDEQNYIVKKLLDEIENKIKEIETESLYFYIPIEFELKYDSDLNRENNKILQKIIDYIIKKILNTYNLNYIEIKGDIKERIQKIKEIIKRELSL